MKKLIIAALLISALSSCRNMQADYAERKAGVLKVCPTCTFVTSEMHYYACDTNVQPNIIYQVYFRNGGLWYKASDVDHLVRIN